ncbi:MAG: hypothetical protein A3G32_06230 [Deltaproteobacteria bacterium RIFCSPLOWO2_12_FULL_40_28]|nr:MAG: hypothetical protein A3C45_02325 [Deltaproteobacteria bacterium RIFCSPHIGHO2_02_FULL_40_28]OGQ19052.1 MAG: hypothetical protein A3E27_05415 [Deltaproteobacteria bacterium RIFCSPHIGHO2_12_FULL_40_32]OGQ40224.1 MAG: hypothetical protein A3I69_00855 [Deltaproteobacteria bacterium RIFCSPLOWO2_02_FULL_40_36]OGQ53495.1 MAG: hypothetical protein A3G32_06230 [Deltaproteobacteria bacterium RIFCSPLOWO2_12_FULL_40_28]
MKLSGKFVLRMHPTLHEKLITHAQKTALSLNETCLELINQGLENQKLIPLIRNYRFSSFQSN